MPPLRCCAANAPAPATLFVQLSTLRPVASPILENILVPRQFYATAGRQIATATATATKPWTIPSSSTVRGTIQRPRWRHGVRQQMRAFTVSPKPRTTHAIFNPKVDEDGKEMKLEITPRAANRLSQIMSKDSNPHLALRIQVESGGCHGFQYLMKLVTLPASLPSSSEAAANDTEVREDDTIFTYAPDDGGGSSATDLSAPKIILDQPSLDLLKGSKVDFTMELIGSQFKIVDNPLATSSCGCGTSFDIKV
ncbi:hypothetical protein B0H66DRAFT_566863 [Apodospora peruviana]|uniref:Core domain-containing protein n=1 Tax=Apodospora peruviana TaxID=516989 RepID=A0AAE0HW88_9PEZI|nr:hypothetical protein B0H66DRAFT_566863 [Apodospora peruviana]